MPADRPDAARDRFRSAHDAALTMPKQPVTRALDDREARRRRVATLIRDLEKGDWRVVVLGVLHPGTSARRPVGPPPRPATMILSNIAPSDASAILST